MITEIDMWDSGFCTKCKKAFEKGQYNHFSYCPYCGTKLISYKELIK